MVWWPVLISILTVQTAFWGGIALATGLAIAGGGWQCWTVASVTLCLYGLGVAWGLIRNNTAKIHLPVWKQYRSARRFDSQAWPVSGLGGSLLMLVSLGVQSIYWRGNYWHVTANGSVRFEGKRPHENILRVGGREIASPISKPDADAKKKQRAA
jgi:hypothetical protein